MTENYEEQTFPAKSIGRVKSPYKTKGDAPFQGRMRNETEMEIVLYPKYREGIGEAGDLTHLIVLVWFNQSEGEDLSIITPWSKDRKPLFQTRSPNRPNPIGFEIAEIVSIADGVIRVKGMDTLDGTPVLDIKPYNPSLDCIPEAGGTGWMGPGKERHKLNPY